MFGPGSMALTVAHRVTTIVLDRRSGKDRRLGRRWGDRRRIMIGMIGTFAMGDGGTGLMLSSISTLCLSPC